MEIFLIIWIILVVAIVVLILVCTKTISLDELRARHFNNSDAEPHRIGVHTPRLSKEVLDRRLTELEGRTSKIACLLNDTISKVNYCNSQILEMSRYSSASASHQKEIDVAIRSLTANVETMRQDLLSFRNATQQEYQPARDSRICNKPSYPFVRYCIVPENANGFKESELSQNEDGMVYRIEIESETYATYQLVSNTAIRSQLFQILQSAIMPYCEVQQESSFVSEIIDVEAGILLKENGFWKISKKAIIKLI